MAIAFERRTRAAGSPATEFFPCLESLRSVCALVVALFHVTWTNHILLIPAMDRAWTFVDFFFVLSGFVISNAYLATVRTTGDVRQFMIKRLFRLYPLHIFTLCAVGILQLVSWKILGRGDSFGTNWPVLLALNLSLSHAVGFSSGMILNVPSWSISVELYAYLLFCIICLAGHKMGAWFPLIVAAIIISLIMMMTLHPEQGLSTPADSSLARGIFGFGIGCLVTLFRRHFALRITGLMADGAIAIVGALILHLMTGYGEHSAALFWLPPAFALFILVITSAAQSQTIRFLETRLFRNFGQISYSIYMNHVFVLMGFSFVAGRIASGPKIAAEHGLLHAVPLAWGDILALAFVVTLLVLSWGTYQLIENPGRLLGRRLASGLEPK
jgi:peptidoglycan/LPS O-acetylase OafA/YrhL